VKNILRSAIAVSAVVVALHHSIADAKPEKDEVKASRFLYCMNVVQFFYQYHLKHDQQNPAFRLYRDSRVYFRLGAALLSEGDFVLRENDRALKRVIELLEREKSEGKNFADAELSSCLVTFNEEVVPLIKSESEGK
jgi:hypothetical protein